MITDYIYILLWTFDKVWQPHQIVRDLFIIKPHHKKTCAKMLVVEGHLIFNFWEQIIILDTQLRKQNGSS